MVKFNNFFLLLCFKKKSKLSILNDIRHRDLFFLAISPSPVYIQVYLEFLGAFVLIWKGKFIYIAHFIHDGNSKCYT